MTTSASIGELFTGRLASHHAERAISEPVDNAHLGASIYSRLAGSEPAAFTREVR